MVRHARRCLFLLMLAGGLLGEGISVATATGTSGDGSRPGARSQSDSLHLGPAEPIAEVRVDVNGDQEPDRVGDTVTVAGRVTAGRGQLALPQPGVAALQDSTGGLHVLLPDGPLVEPGDSLRVRGVIDHANGLARLQAVDYSVVHAPSRVPAPLPLSVASADGERYEGRLVRVQGRVAVKNRNEGGQYLVLEGRSEGTTAQVTVFVANRHLNRMELDRFGEGNEIEVTGVLGQYNYSYQVEPRGAADLASVGSGTPYLWMGLLVLAGSGVGAIGIWVLLRSAVRRRTRELEESRRKLREREEQFRGLTNSIPGVVFQFFARPDGTTGNHFVSEHAESLLGISADPETFQERFIERVPMSHREKLRDSIREAVEEQKPWRFEMPFEKPNGERIWLLGTSTPEERDDELVFNGVILDITERKRTEQTLKEERDRFETLFESLPTPVIHGTRQDDAPIVLDANKAFEEVFGRDAEAVRGASLQNFIVPDGKQVEANALSRRSEEERPLRTEVRRRTVEGVRDFQLQLAMREPSRGKAEGYAIYTDITERKQRERELEETNATLEAILENLPAGVLTEDATREIIATNSRFCEIVGLKATPNELEGISCKEAAQEAAGRFADPERFLERTEAVIEAGAPMFGEELQLADGRILERDFVPYKVPGGEAALWLYQDVTERKRRQQMLERQNDLFAKAQAMANVGAWEYDVQADALTWTEQVYEIHELPTDTDLTPAKGIDFYHPDDRPTIREAFTRAVDEGVPYDEELRIVTARGEERWVRTRGEPQTENGTVVRVRGTFRDVTERKRREQELRRAKEEAEGAARLKTAMLANMSHEIRTPLTSITGFAEVLKDDLEGRPKDFADRIYRSGERLMKTLDSVLQLSKLEAGTYELEEESVRLEEVVEETVDLLHRDAAEKSITLETSLCEDPVKGPWNEAALNRVAENLLENAIKFTPEGGTVGVRVEQEGEEAVLEVEDTGVGISDEALPNVFKAFTQESEGLDREYEGSGLGLSIVRRLVEAHDGSIAVETEKGAGTAFTVRLPLRRNGEGG